MFGHKTFIVFLFDVHSPFFAQSWQKLDLSVHVTEHTLHVDGQSFAIAPGLERHSVSPHILH